MITPEELADLLDILKASVDSDVSGPIIATIATLESRVERMEAVVFRAISTSDFYRRIEHMDDDNGDISDNFEALLDSQLEAVEAYNKAEAEAKEVQGE